MHPTPKLFGIEKHRLLMAVAWLFFSALVGAFCAAALSGCAATHHAPAAVHHTAPPAASNQSTIERLTRDLTAWNVGSFVGLAVSVGLLATPASPVAHWLIPIFGSLTGMSLAGALSLPWIALAVKIALAILAAVVLATIAYWIYRAIKDRSPKQATTDLVAEFHTIEADVGLAGTKAAPIVAASTPTK